jgi:hypothetical protein
VKCAEQWIVSEGNYDDWIEMKAGDMKMLVTNIQADATSDLQSQVDQLRGEVVRSDQRNAEHVKAFLVARSENQDLLTALEKCVVALEFAARILKQVYVGPEAPTPYKAQDARESCLDALATAKSLLNKP